MTTVTQVATALQFAALIRCNRGHIEIVDRKKIEAARVRLLRTHQASNGPTVLYQNDN
jgi:hypothetical protein